MPQTQNQQLFASCIAIAGGQTALARKINAHLPDGVRRIVQADVYKWLHKRRRPCPPDIYVIPVELAVNGIVTRYQLRPDVFGSAPPRAA